MTETMSQPEPDAPTQDRVIADALIADIVEWRIEPGSWIREREIAQRFGVSHAPVREAFRHVAHIGLIQVVPWRGAHVIEVDRHAVTEIFELWKANFGVVCRLAALAMSDADSKELMVRLEGYKALVHRTKNTFEHLASSNRVGAFIARRCGGHLATDVLNRIAVFASWQHRVISADFFSIEAGIRSAELYEILCRHIVAREPDAADSAARALLGYLQERFAEPLEEYLAASRARATPRRRTRSKRNDGSQSA
ncbi:GntR family transcriptional regulator [Sphingomonas sp.]|uniref:GntR family transcriptional regulator n=1 Tax=Sphingomonas sp. TaxID=28214 RepID=UPI0025EC56A9|nr:GntR family transcriptional regulator [Sphingomonas sp.]